MRLPLGKYTAVGKAAEDSSLVLLLRFRYCFKFAPQQRGGETRTSTATVALTAGRRTTTRWRAAMEKGTKGGRWQETMVTAKQAV